MCSICICFALFFCGCHTIVDYFEPLMCMCLHQFSLYVLSARRKGKQVRAYANAFFMMFECMLSFFFALAYSISVRRNVRSVSITFTFIYFFVQFIYLFSFLSLALSIPLRLSTHVSSKLANISECTKNNKCSENEWKSFFFAAIFLFTLNELWFIRYFFCFCADGPSFRLA